MLNTVPAGFVLKYEVQGNSPVEIPQLGGTAGVLVGVAVNVVVDVGVGVTKSASHVGLKLKILSWSRYQY